MRNEKILLSLVLLIFLLKFLYLLIIPIEEFYDSQVLLSRYFLQDTHLSKIYFLFFKNISFQPNKVTMYSCYYFLSTCEVSKFYLLYLWTILINTLPILFFLIFALVNQKYQVFKKFLLTRKQTLSISLFLLTPTIIFNTSLIGSEAFIISTTLIWSLFFLKTKYFHFLIASFIFFLDSGNGMILIIFYIIYFILRLIKSITIRVLLTSLCFLIIPFKQEFFEFYQTYISVISFESGLLNHINLIIKDLIFYNENLKIISNWFKPLVTYFYFFHVTDSHFFLVSNTTALLLIFVLFKILFNKDINLIKRIFKNDCVLTSILLILSITFLFPTHATGKYYIFLLIFFIRIFLLIFDNKKFISSYFIYISLLLIEMAVVL